MSKDIKTISALIDDYGLENWEHKSDFMQSIQQIIERDVIGEDEPGVTNVMIAMEHNHQRQALTNVLYGKGEDKR